MGRQTPIKRPKLEDTPHSDETLIKEAFQSSAGIKRALPLLGGFGGKSNNKVIISDGRQQPEGKTQRRQMGTATFNNETHIFPSNTQRFTVTRTLKETPETTSLNKNQTTATSEQSGHYFLV